MTWRDYLGSETKGKVHDEELLNVFRRSEEDMLGNKDVADTVGMSTEGVKKRLLKLRENDRVKGKKIGDTWVWTLHPDERRKPVPPDIDRLVHFLDWIDEKASLFVIGGLFATILGFSFIYWAVTEAFILGTISGVSPRMMLVVGWALAVAGGLVGGAAGLARLGLWLIGQTAVQRMVEPQAADLPSDQRGETRGQITLRLLIGGIILLVLAKPLSMAAIEIYQSLVVTSAFSPFWAAAFALSVVGLVVAAIFEGGR